MIVAALAIFQALIWVVMCIDKFVTDIGVRNILDPKITWSRNMLVSGWPAGRLFRCITITDLML